MEPSNLPPCRPSPRRELQLQGPRPSPLKLRKDSHKIKKPPAGPPRQHPPPPQNRAPIIIYAVSPKVIHTDPAGFMTLVQRLTGPASDGSAAATSAPPPPSPAARIAAFERSGTRVAVDKADMEFGGGAPLFPGILSPVPGSLPPISPAFFSPSFDLSFVSSFLQELSPVAGGGKGSSESGFLASPNNFFSTPVIPSPGAYWDLFNLLKDS